MPVTAKFLFAATVSSLLFVACNSQPTIDADFNIQSESVDRGRQLIMGAAHCGFCHGESKEPGSRLSGGQELVDRYGKVAVPNITTSESGVGDWSAGELVAAIRYSVSKDGYRQSRTMHRGYQWMSDRDLFDILSYLASQEPVENTVEPRQLGFVSRNFKGFSDSWDVQNNYVPEIDKSNPAAYGKYLVDNVARCSECHGSAGSDAGSSDYLSGNHYVAGIGEQKTAPALLGDDSVQINKWGPDGIRRFLFNGITPSGNQVDRSSCPVNFYARSSEQQIYALTTYLSSLE